MTEHNPLVDILQFYKDLGVTHLDIKPPSADTLEAGIKDCSRCVFSQGRSGYLPGWGSPQAELLLVADALTADSLRQGTPVAGDSWELLQKIIRAIDIDPKDVYLTNAVKCFADGKSKPTANEIEACRPWLLTQFKLVNPRVVVALGTVAAQSVLATDQVISAIRGKFYYLDDYPVMPTFHPEYLLHHPRSKGDVWHDMKMVRDRLKQGR